MSQDNPSTELGKHHLAEWITELYYGGAWYQIKPGSYEKFKTSAGIVHSYEDPYSGEEVTITEPVHGYKFRTPETNVIPFQDRK